MKTPDDTQYQPSKEEMQRQNMNSFFFDLFTRVDSFADTSDTELSTRFELSGGKNGDIRPCFVLTFNFHGDSARQVSALMEVASEVMDNYGDEMVRDDSPDDFEDDNIDD